MLLSIKCPIPDCPYETPECSEAVTYALLAAHSTIHMTGSPYAAVVIQGPKLERSKVNIGVTLEEWNIFKRRWDVFVSGSRFLASVEQRYEPIEGEALAVAWGLEQSKYFTQGRNDLLVVTDHKPLVKILGDRTLVDISNTRIVRLKQRTLPCSFDIAHLPGKTNSAADATSRHPSPANEFAELRCLSLHSERTTLKAQWQLRYVTTMFMTSSPYHGNA